MDARVTVAVADHVADVRLARAERMNALDPAMFEGLADTIDALARRDDVRCVVLSGEGRGFCAGLDMASMAAGGSGIDLDTRHPEGANAVQQVAWGWRTLPMPVIAAVHGVAFGGGLQVMAGADIRIAAPETRFAVREMHWGLVPDMAGMALWRSLVRDDVLRELTYSAREFSADEAVAAGFVTRVADDPLAAASALARTIAERSPRAVRAAKRLFAAVAATNDPAAILKAETDAQRTLLGHPEQAEAVRANLERRAPRFAAVTGTD